ncbi:MAG: DUF3426 domain-containing protein [Gammaproteobacteria bacterium]|nr:DUF3426 domain-containing protein [Gammaproteobacteria bacterium]
MAEDDAEPLVTQCPKCRTRFRVTENQLQIAAGRVRCGACLTVFQGVEHLHWDKDSELDVDPQALDGSLDELDDASPEETPELAPDSAQADPIEQPVKDAESALPDLDAVGDDPISVAGDPDDEWSRLGGRLYGGHEESAEPVSEALEAEALARIETLPVEDSADADAEDVAHEIGVEDTTVHEPLVTERREESATTRQYVFGPEPTERRWWVTVAMALALAALVGQLLWYQFETWGRDPTFRPVYGVICQVLDCELPVRHDVGSMLAKNLVVRSHPDLAKVLLVDAIIVNQAEFVQPFPELELRFTSLQGSLVAGRRFSPEEYLAGELSGATMMPMRTPIHVELVIEDPGEEAVNYFLSFH